jgi:hypothetical protein
MIIQARRSERLHLFRSNGPLVWSIDFIEHDNGYIFEMLTDAKTGAIVSPSPAVG